jgi:hypothetical protein
VGVALRAEKWSRSNFWVVVVVVALVAVGYTAVILLTHYGGGHLFVSGCGALLVALWLGLTLTDQVGRTLWRLSERGSLVGDPTLLERRILRTSDRYAAVGGVVVALLMLSVFTVTYWTSFPDPLRVFLTLFATAAGFIAGRVLGRMVAVGLLGPVIESDRAWSIQPQVHGLDGAAGLAPVGSLYFRQAAIMLVPAVFCAAWWFAIPLIPRFAIYGIWRKPYLILLAVSVAFQLLVFILPMLWFHTQMTAWKDRVLSETEVQAARELRDLDAALSSTGDVRERAALNDEVALVKERYQAVRHLPTWPVDAPTRRRFTVRNVVLLIPLVGQLFGQGDILRQVGSTFNDIFG